MLTFERYPGVCIYRTDAVIHYRVIRKLISTAKVVGGGCDARCWHRPQFGIGCSVLAPSGATATPGETRSINVAHTHTHTGSPRACCVVSVGRDRHRRPPLTEFHLTPTPAEAQQPDEQMRPGVGPCGSGSGSGCGRPICAPTFVCLVPFARSLANCMQISGKSVGTSVPTSD